MDIEIYEKEKVNKFQFDGIQSYLFLSTFRSLLFNHQGYTLTIHKYITITNRKFTRPREKIISENIKQLFKL